MMYRLHFMQVKSYNFVFCNLVCSLYFTYEYTTWCIARHSYMIALHTADGNKRIDCNSRGHMYRPGLAAGQGPAVSDALPAPTATEKLRSVRPQA